MRTRRTRAPQAGRSRQPALNGRPASPWRASRERLLDREVKREAVIRAALRQVKSLRVPARERLSEVLRNYAQAVASEFGWCMVRVEDQDLSAAMSAHIKSMKSEIDHGIRRLIREGVQDGSIHPCDPKMTAFALAGSLNWIAHWYRENQSLTAAQIADAFMAVFDNGLRPRGANGARRATAGRSARPRAARTRLPQAPVAR